jgi:hypothetical protein
VIKTYRQRYNAVGVKTIPLPAGAKKPPLKGWHTLSSSEQWERWHGNANIGINPVGDLAIIDAENQTAYTDARDGLNGMGIDPDRLPIVRTASGVGRHVYVRIDGAPEAEHTRRLAVGEQGRKKGELLFGSRCYAVAPMSTVGGNRYEFVHGAPELLATLPVLNWQDLSWLVIDRPHRPPLGISRPPLPLVERLSLPEKAEFLLDNLPFAPRRQGVLKEYETRSEAEQAVITMAILAGWSYDRILAEFWKRQPGHFAEHDKPAWYFRISYDNALANILADTTRQDIVTAYWNVALAPWPGRGGDLERMTLLALLCMCWQFASWTVRASQRDLATLANATQPGVGNALQRLESDHICRVSNWAWTGVARAAKYQVAEKLSQNSGHGHTYKSPTVTYEKVILIGLHPIWCQDGLGRSTGHVYDLIVAGISTEDELVERSGKTGKTVRRALGILESRGLIRQDDSWVLGGTTRDQVAKAEGFDSLAKRRAERFAGQREFFYTERPSGRQVAKPSDLSYTGIARG